MEWLGLYGSQLYVRLDYRYRFQQVQFYLGPGVGIGYAYGRFWNKYDYSPLRVNVGGQFGFEYQFDIPLNLSIDWRPMVNVLGFRQELYPIYNSFYNFAVGVRYRF